MWIFIISILYVVSAQLLDLPPRPPAPPQLYAIRRSNIIMQILSRLTDFLLSFLFIDYICLVVTPRPGWFTLGDDLAYSNLNSEMYNGNFSNGRPINNRMYRSY